jgi:hypothetical protein
MDPTLSFRASGAELVVSGMGRPRQAAGYPGCARVPASGSRHPVSLIRCVVFLLPARLVASTLILGSWIQCKGEIE